MKIETMQDVMKLKKNDIIKTKHMRYRIISNRYHHFYVTNLPQENLIFSIPLCFFIGFEREDDKER